MNSKEILLEKDRGIAIITLNRPERFNSMTTAMYQELPLMLEQLRRDDDIKVVILTGSGKAFCAGSDVSDRLGKRLEKGGEDSRFENLQQVGAIALSFPDFEKPIIAAVNGVAVGAGLSLALLCDFRLASDKARFWGGMAERGADPRSGCDLLHAANCREGEGAGVDAESGSD